MFRYIKVLVGFNFDLAKNIGVNLPYIGFQAFYVIVKEY